MKESPGASRGFSLQRAVAQVAKRKLPVVTGSAATHVSRFRKSLLRDVYLGRSVRRAFSNGDLIYRGKNDDVSQIAEAADSCCACRNAALCASKGRVAVELGAPWLLPSLRSSGEVASTARPVGTVLGGRVPMGDLPRCACRSFASRKRLTFQAVPPQRSRNASRAFNTGFSR